MKTVNKVFVSRKFICSPAELFDWLVQPELIAQWFGPKHLIVGEVHSNLEVDGQISIELKKANGSNFFIKGQYLEIDKPEKLVFSYQYSDLQNPPPESVVTIKLKALNQNQTELTLIQSFEQIPEDMPSRKDAWNHMLQVLENQVS